MYMASQKSNAEDELHRLLRQAGATAEEAAALENVWERLQADPQEIDILRDDCSAKPREREGEFQVWRRISRMRYTTVALLVEFSAAKGLVLLGVVDANGKLFVANIITNVVAIRLRAGENAGEIEARLAKEEYGSAQEERCRRLRDEGDYRGKPRRKR